MRSYRDATEAHDGYRPRSAFAHGMVVLDPAQAVGECIAVQRLLEAYLERVDPSAAWDAHEARRRASAQQN